MAAYRDRSMNAELIEGSLDGSYKRYLMNVSNYPDADRRMNIANRKNLMRNYGGYGIYEAGRDRVPLLGQDGSTEKRTIDGRFAI